MVLFIYLFIYLFFVLLYFSGLKPNLTISEIAGIEVLKGAQVEVFRILYIDVINDTLRILAACYLYLNICGTMQISR